MSTTNERPRSHTETPYWYHVTPEDLAKQREEWQRDHGDDPIYMSSEGDSSKLKWRPAGKNTTVPEDVCRSRFSLLEPDDAEKLTKEFSRGKAGKELKSLYFGGNVYGDEQKNAAATMMRCAFVAKDAEGALRLFESSAAFDAERNDKGLILDDDGKGGYYVYDPSQKYTKLADRAAQMEKECRAKVAAEKDVSRRVKDKSSKSLAMEGRCM